MTRALLVALVACSHPAPAPAPTPSNVAAPAAPPPDPAPGWKIIRVEIRGSDTFLTVAAGGDVVRIDSTGQMATNDGRRLGPVSVVEIYGRISVWKVVRPMTDQPPASRVIPDGRF